MIWSLLKQEYVWLNVLLENVYELRAVLLADVCWDVTIVNLCLKIY